MADQIQSGARPEALLLSIKDSAQLLGVGRSQVYELLRAGHLRATRIGVRGVRIAWAEIERFARDGVGGVD